MNQPHSPNLRHGISTPSVYAAFGSKEALFRECVQRYLASYGQVTEFLWDTSLSPRDALETTLRRSAKMQCEPGHPTGCMVGLGVMSAPSAENAAVAVPLARSRDRTRAGMAATIARSVATGQLNTNIDVNALAAMFSTFLFGISIQARNGASIDELPPLKRSWLICI